MNGMEVVGRLTGRRLLVERLVGGEHQRQVAVEQVAELVERRARAAPVRCPPT